MVTKLGFGLRKQKELLEKENCTSWLPNLEINQVIDEEYLQMKMALRGQLKFVSGGVLEN